MTQRCKKRLVKKYNTQSLHILRDHVRCAPAPRYNCPHLHFYFMLFCAPASHFTHPHLFHLSFPHPRSRRKVPNSAVWHYRLNTVISTHPRFRRRYYRCGRRRLPQAQLKLSHQMFGFPPTVGVHRNQFFKFRPEPDPTGTGKKFWPEVPAGTGTNLLIKPYIVICYFVRCQTGRHFKSLRRELANVRIKRLTNVKRHNEVLIIVYISLA